MGRGGAVSLGPPPAWKPVSLHLQLVLYTPLILRHTACTSVLNPGWKPQLSPLLFKPQPDRGALGGFLWSQVSFLIAQHSGWLCWPWALCRAHPGPHSSARAVPAPRPLAPLVLTTLCPPSRHNRNIPFPSALVSLALIWWFWGTLHLPADTFAPLFHPGCDCCARVWTPEGHRVPGRQGRCLTGSR